MDPDRLISLERWAFQRAERWQAWAWRAQAAVLVLACAAVFVASIGVTHWLALGGFGIFCFWFFAVDSSERIRAAAERARRLVLFMYASDSSQHSAEYADVVASLETLGAKEGKWDGHSYFSASVDPERGPLSQQLEESVFWSKHLLRASARRGYLYTGLTVALGLALLIALPQLESTTLAEGLARAVCLVLSWLIAADGIGSVLRFARSARYLERVVPRASVLTSSGGADGRLLVALSDYNAAVQSAPIIPTSIYLRHCAALERAWDSTRSGIRAVEKRQPPN